MKIHRYDLSIKWTGAQDKGTRDYKSYKRDHEIVAKSKEILHASSDPAFRGDATKYNPEELLVSALSSCHMLWYLHLCAVNGVVVLEYEDQATGMMIEAEDGSGRFTSVTLRPTIKVMQEDMIDRAKHLHSDANKMCFIANSVNFEVNHEAVINAVEH